MDVQVSAQPIEYCFLWIDWWPLCMDKQSWAAWVQAVGSIAAIGGAFAIVLWQQRMSDVTRYRERIQTELNAVDALGGLFLLADAMTSAAYNSAGSKASVIQLFAIKDSFSRSSALIDALMNTPLSRLLKYPAAKSTPLGRDALSA